MFGWEYVMHLAEQNRSSLGRMLGYTKQYMWKIKSEKYLSENVLTKMEEMFKVDREFLKIESVTEEDKIAILEAFLEAKKKAVRGE